ncbi:MAG: carbamate kinase [Candidatus Hydrogenedentota bacterium]
MKMLIALGGNAITKETEIGTIEQQWANTAQTMKEIAKVVEQGHSIVITHGNGPQIGNIMRRIEIASKEVYPLPLDVCVSDSQGGMGYMIQTQLMNELRKIGMKDKISSTIITTCLVSKDDPGMKEPTKPIGPFYTKEQAEEITKTRGWIIKEDAGRGYRRVVFSPKPLKIVEKDAIEKLMNAGVIIIACGGGGIPVIEENGRYHGIDAVIDKDRASSLLAREIKIDLFVILTGVDKVAINFKKPDQKYLDKITLSEAERYLKEGHFPAGSMGPKIEASIDFLQNGGKEVLITSAEHLLLALDYKTGTRIVK